MKQKRIAASLATGAIAALAITGCSAGMTEGGDDGGRQATEPKEKPAGGSAPFNDGAADITVKSCGLGDPWGLGESIPVMDISVKNSSGKTSSYYYEAEVTDSSGKRIETLVGGVENVAPGQTVDTGAGDGEEDPLSALNKNLSGEVNCKLISADRTPSH